MGLRSHRYVDVFVVCKLPQSHDLYMHVTDPGHVTRRSRDENTMSPMGETKMWTAFLLLTLVSAALCQTRRDRPNIVFILTDDQDVEIGGTNPITKARKLIGDAGIVFKNMYVTSPLCCPSRSSILTGNYVHNHGALNNSVSGNCSSPAWQKNSETKAFAPYLKKNGYRTFFAGKYLNQYGFPHSGGTKHVPPGWDEWNGLVGNSVYYDYALSVNGKQEKHGHKYPDDYLTDVIAKRGIKFINDQENWADPFFVMLSTPACHAPFTPAPQYKGSFSDVKAPRNGSFNHPSPDKHWLLRVAPHPISNKSLQIIDPVYRNRWRTLLSVDDMVESIVDTLTKKKLLDNTYIIFSSDNGYHLGQMSLPYDKRQLYEFDIHVPLMVRGPGITPKQHRDEVILNIDFAPTFVDLSGAPPPSSMDGQSFKKLLQVNTSVGEAWRTDFMVEHSGEVQETIKDCPKLNRQEVSQCYPDCVCEDSYNNTYSCVRTISKKLNLMYCEFADSETFIEVYDLHKDPHQLSNIAKTIDPQVMVKQNKRLVDLTLCTGASCRGPQPYPPAPAPAS